MRCRVIVTLMTLSQLCLCTATLRAQQALPRPVQDSLLALLAHNPDANLFRQAAGCGARTGAAARLCDALAVLRMAERTGTLPDALKALGGFERMVEDQPRTALAWYGLGLARLEAAKAGALAREGPLSPTGVSLEASAASALIRALALNPELVVGVDALALAPIPREGKSALQDRIVTLRQHVSQLSPAGLYGAALVELEGGSADTAVAFLRQSLRAGNGREAGLVNLQLARALYRANLPTLGREALLAGASDTSRLAVAAYRQELSWVATPEEIATWDGLRPTARRAWLADFWAQRDVLGGQADGSRLMEHYRRLELALSQYRVTLPHVGRQLVSTRSSTVDYFADEYYLRVLNTQVEQTAPEEAVRLAVMERSVEAGVVGAAIPFHSFKTSQNLIDDRGLVYLRFGQPDQSASTHDGIALELWRYNFPDGPMVLSFREVDFDGQIGASELVPSLITADLRQRNQLCHLDTSICSSLADPASTTLLTKADGRIHSTFDKTRAQDVALQKSSSIARAFKEGLERIQVATSTDAFGLRFDQPLHASMQIFGLRHLGGSGDGRVVIAFAVPGHELQATYPPAAGGRAVYALRVHVAAELRALGHRSDLDTTRLFVTGAALQGDQYLTGTAEVPVAAGTYAVSVTITQEGGRGALATLAKVVVPGAEPVLTVSDIVLGSPKTGLRWNSGRSDVALNPLNNYARTDQAAVYYQVRGLILGVPSEHRFEFFSSERPLSTPSYSIAFTDTPRLAEEEIVRGVDIHHLTPGHYRLRVTIRQGASSTSASSWINVGR